MKAKTCLKTVGSVSATVTSAAVAYDGAKGFAAAEDTKGKIIAGIKVVAGAAGTFYSGSEALKNGKELASGLKKSKNSPEAVAQNIQK